MNKIFEILAKPAKLVLIIGGFVYGLWFAIRTGMSMDGEFMNVLTNLIILVVGTALICLPPILLLLKREELAKLFFVFLIGFWVLSTPTGWFFYAETFASNGADFYPALVGVMLFVIGFAVIGILVLLILEMILNLKFLRPIINLVAFITIIACIVTAIFFMILCALNNAGWNLYVEDALFGMIILPVVVGFGCLYFFGAKAKDAK